MKTSSEALLQKLQHAYAASVDTNRVPFVTWLNEQIIADDPDALAYHAAQGVTRPGYEANEAETAYTIHGFNLISTGGNCTAFYKPLNVEGSRFILVTLREDAEAPQSIHDAVRVGLYNDQHSEELDGFFACNLADVVALLAAREWKA